MNDENLREATDLTLIPRSYKCISYKLIIDETIGSNNQEIHQLSGH